jgi:lysophospholipase L1-like esterase
MAQDGVEKVLYFFYPDPIGNNYASLTACLNRLRPEMKSLCEGLTAPKCYWLDLRPTWEGHNEYPSDGIHPTEAGSVATGNAIWAAMEEHCIAQ